MRGKGSKTTIIFVIGLLPFVMVLGNSMLIPILPTVQGDMGLTEFEGGLILTVFAIPAALIIPLVGFLSDRYGRKRIILISLLSIVVGSFISAFSVDFSMGNTTFQWFLVGRILQGLGAGGTTPIAMAMMADLFEGKDRSQALGALEVFNGIGKVLSPILGATAALFFWYSAFYFYGIVALVALLGMILFISGKGQTRNDDSIKLYYTKIRKVFKREGRWLFPLFFLGGTGMFLLFGMLFFLSYEIERIYRIDGFFKGTVFTIPLGTLTFISYWTGKQIGVDRNKMRRFIFFGSGMMFFSFLFLYFFHQMSGLIFGLTVASTGLGLVLPCCSMLITSSINNEERGLLVSFYGMTRFLGVALGPIVYSSWMETISMMFLYSLIILGVATVWLYFSLEKKSFTMLLANK